MPGFTRKYDWIMVLGFCWLTILCSCGEKRAESKKVVVRVRNEELTLDMLKEMIPLDNPNTLSYEQVQNYIQRWIEQELMYQEAVNLGLKKNDVELNKILRQAEKNYLVDSLLDSLLTADVPITEDEVLEYYEKNKDNFLSERMEIRALHILVDDINTAREVRRRLVNGEDFESVAKEVSLDYQRHQRIDLGYFASENIIPEIGNLLFRQGKGALTQPLSSQFGYHIFKILDKRNPNTQRELEEVKDEINARLLATKRNEIYTDFIADIKNKVDVKTNFEYLRDLFADSTAVSSDLMSK